MHPPKISLKRGGGGVLLLQRAEVLNLCVMGLGNSTAVMVDMIDMTRGGREKRGGGRCASLQSAALPDLGVVRHSRLPSARRRVAS